MAPEPYHIVGLEGTGTHPRLEITDLQKNPIQFSLFIRALRRLLDKKSEYGKSPNYSQSPTSWWQIGGIHGLPFEPWAGDPEGPQKPAEPSTSGGYCYHAAALFPPWHRVQVLLVEQAVVREAVDIAAKLPEHLPVKSAWVKAANELRFPFWDWTSEQTAKEGILKVFQEVEISIVNPTGLLPEKVPNPLNHYKFPDNHKPGPAGPGLGVWSRTYRWVDFNHDVPTEDYEGARQTFQRGGGPWGSLNESIAALRRKVSGLFNYPLTIEGDYGANLWGRFSNTGSSTVYVPEKRYESLPSIEDPHNHIHVNVGGSGTMAFPTYASFDPIFWLHHCNVDRIFAYWEWVYPDYWIGDKGWKTEQGDFLPFTTAGTFSQTQGSEVSAETPLVPFRFKDNNYWTSEQVRGLWSASRTQKYYTYPGIIDEKTKVAAHPHGDNSSHTLEDREKIRQLLYNHWGTDLATEVQNIREVFAARQWSAGIRSILLEEPEGKDQSYLRNFVIVGEVPAFAFPGSYRLELYLRPEGDDPTYIIDDITVFGRLDPDECPACKDRQAAGSQVRGHIHIDPLLIIHLLDWNVRRGGHLPEGKPPLDWVVNQIKERFRLRLAAPDGTILADTESASDDGRHDLETHKIPRLTLHWHRIWFNRQDLSVEKTSQKGYIPLGLHEADEHGELELGGVWKKV